MLPAMRGNVDTIHVFDVRAQGKTGSFHFDVMTTDQERAVRLARNYVAGIGESGAAVTGKECQFCHSEPLVMFSSEQQRQFREQGGFIVTLSS